MGLALGAVGSVGGGAISTVIKRTSQKTAGCLGAGYTNILLNLGAMLLSVSQHQTQKY